MDFKGVILYFESGRLKKYNQMTFFAFTFANNNILENETKGTYLCIISESATKNAERVRPFLGWEKPY